MTSSLPCNVVEVTVTFAVIQDLAIPLLIWFGVSQLPEGKLARQGLIMLGLGLEYDSWRTRQRVRLT